ncbi:MAG: 30S ribosomal protein S17 [Candidatus Harrisonbacteria bacterium]|nr:30S ribosomal protein S17 [Candidatus Harrisonbacteria bacterium]
MSILNIFTKISPEENSQSRNQKISSQNRKLKGVVVSNKMKKTVVVAITRSKKHSKYQKYFTVTKRFKAHDEKNEYQVGDKVIIQETRPISKEKRWIVISKI